MMRSDTADEVLIPDDVAAALRRAAEVIPAEQSSVDVVARRARHLRRRRGAALGGSLVALAIVGAAVVVAQREPDREAVTTDDPPATVPAPTPETSLPPAEPLFVDWGAAEVLPDGTVVDLTRILETDSIGGRPVRMADGRLLATGTRNLMPGVERTDGALVEGVAFLLTVFAPDGTKVAEYDLRIVGEYVELIGAVGNDAILARTTADGNCCGLLPGVRVSAFDVTSGAERALLEVEDLYGARGDLSGNRAAFLVGGTPETSDGSCSVKVVDLALGRITDSQPFACLGAERIDVSPDGRRAAVVYQTETLELDLVFVDLDAGTIVSQLHLYEPQGEGPQPQVQYAGMAWSDDRTVRVALQDIQLQVSEGETTCCQVDPERLRVETFSVD